MTRIKDPGFRVDTGPLKFGDDWTGVFIRGDQAGAYSDLLNIVAKKEQFKDIKPLMEELSALLGSCRT